MPMMARGATPGLVQLVIDPSGTSNGDELGTWGQVDSTPNHVVRSPFGEPAVSKSTEDALGGDQTRRE
jgi:hypothetical protein